MNHGQFYICRIIGIPQQFERRRGIQDRGVRVVVIEDPVRLLYFTRISKNVPFP